MWSKNCLSRIFQPVSLTPKSANLRNEELTSKSQRLMLELGLIGPSSSGCYHLMPLCLRSLEKLVKIVEEAMSSIGAQKLSLNSLIKRDLWVKSGRFQEEIVKELFQLKDRHQHDFILSPTHEEAVCGLLQNVPALSYKQLPLKLYQVSSKYRDEMKPRFGLLRGKEFLMKDLYSFDLDVKSALETYQEVSSCYEDLLRRLKVDFVKVEGSCGMMGGSKSHEFHFKSEIGEDKLLICNKCKFQGNLEVLKERVCPECTSSSLQELTGIEVGHTFFLGDKYSKPLQAKFVQNNGKPAVYQMGSYGLGLTRILGACLEVGSSETELRWPLVLAPFKVVVIPPKAGSKEETQSSREATEILYEELNKLPGLASDVLLDDRTYLTIGRRVFDASRMGYPNIITIGSHFVEHSTFELINLQENSQIYLSQSDLLQQIKQFI